MKKLKWNKFIIKVTGVFLAAAAVMVLQPNSARATSDYSNFPKSYQPYLRQLSQEHPNWVFIPQDTGLDWNTVVRAESVPRRSLIGVNNPITWKSLKPGDYDKATGKWIGKSGSSWVEASESLIKFTLDPRNCLNENNIFIFEHLKYNELSQSIVGINSILTGTFMDNAYIMDNDGNSVTYAQAFMAIGREIGISPYHIASYVRLEQGTKGDSPLISGTYSNYKGYYNYFNIKASGSTSTAIYNNGLKYAKSMGWDTPYKALLGGAQFLATNYIARGQDTLYLQKFDVDDSDGTLYTHQYMQDIMGSYNKSVPAKNAYISIGALDNPFVFKIPIYSNMPEKAYEKPSNVLGVPDFATPKVSAGYDSIVLKWNEISGAAGYSVYRSETPSGVFTRVKLVDGLTNLTWTDTEVVPNKIYYYKVRSYVGYTNPATLAATSIASEDSVLMRTSTQINPTTVKSLDKTGAIAATINWKKAGNVDGYKVYRSTRETVGFKEIKKITSPDVLTYTDNTLMPNNQYYYRVRSYKALDGTSYISEATKAMKVDMAVDASAVRTLTNKNNGSVEVRWDQSDYVTGYKVYRSNTQDGVFNCIATLTENTSASYTDKSTLPNRNYYYKVRSYVTKNSTKYYGPLSTSKKVDTRVKAVTIRKAESKDFISAEVTWDQLSSPVTGYKVYRSLTETGGYKLADTVKDVKASGYRDAKVTPNETYYYKVRAYLSVNGVNYFSYYTEPVQVSTGLTKPSLQTAVWNMGTEAEVTYKKIANVTGYRIYRSEAGKSYVLVKTIKGADIDAYTDLKIIPNSSYKYSVKAYVTVGKTTYLSPRSNAVTADTSVPVTEILSAVRKSPARAALRWTPVEGCSGYKVYRATSENGSYRLVRTVQKGETVTYTNTTCKAGTAYYYKIRTILTIGDTTYSSAATEPVKAEP